MDKSLKSNAIFNLIYQMMAIIIPLITMPYLARVLGVQNIGIQSYTLSIVSYFVLFAVFGLNTYGQREIARNQKNRDKISKLFFELMLSRFIIGFIVLSIYFVLLFTSFEVVYRYYYLILSMNILSVIFDIAWFFQGVEKFKSLAIRNTIIKLLSAIAVFCFVKNDKHLYIYILISSLSLLISSFSVWFLVPKYINKTKIEYKNIIQHFRKSLVYFIPTIAIQIYTVLDKSMIQWITNSNVQNGIYDQAERIAKVFITIIQFMNIIMCSRMSYLFENKKNGQAKDICMQSFRFLSFIAFPLTFGLILVSNNIIPLYLGPGYEDSIIILQCFSLLIIFISISGFIGSHYMTPTGQQAKSNISLICGSILNLFMNIILIKPLGALGAAIASVSAECLIAILYIYNGRKFINFKEYITVSYKNIISSVVMFGVVCVIAKYIHFNTGNLNVDNLLMILSKVSIGVFTYFMVLLLIKDSFLKSIFNKFIIKIRCK